MWDSPSVVAGEEGLFCPYRTTFAGSTGVTRSSSRPYFEFSPIIEKLDGVLTTFSEPVEAAQTSTDSRGVAEQNRRVFDFC